MIAWRRSQHLIFAGYSENEILRLGDLAKLTNERMTELMHSNQLEVMEKTGEEPNKKILHIPTFSDSPIDKPVVVR